MINALHDEVIPRVCTDDLWEAFGRPSIEWYNCGHYSAAVYLLDVLQKTAAFFANHQDN